MFVGFEDAFTSVQADYISLCLELAQDDVEVVYGYVYLGNGMTTFGVFYRKDGEIKEIEDIAPEDLVDRFYDVGFDDVQKLRDVCTRYEHKCPNQIKMVYDAKTKHFDANYAYLSEAELETVNPDDVFNDWVEDERAKAE